MKQLSEQNESKMKKLSESRLRQIIKEELCMKHDILHTSPMLPARISGNSVITEIVLREYIRETLVTEGWLKTAAWIGIPTIGWLFGGCADDLFGWGEVFESIAAEILAAGLTTTMITKGITQYGPAGMALSALGAGLLFAWNFHPQIFDNPFMASLGLRPGHGSRGLVFALATLALPVTSVSRTARNKLYGLLHAAETEPFAVIRKLDELQEAGDDVMQRVRSEAMDEIQSMSGPGTFTFADFRISDNYWNSHHVHNVTGDLPDPRAGGVTYINDDARDAAWASYKAEQLEIISPTITDGIAVPGDIDITSLALLREDLIQVTVNQERSLFASVRAGYVKLKWQNLNRWRRQLFAWVDQVDPSVFRARFRTASVEYVNRGTTWTVRPIAVEVREGKKYVKWTLDTADDGDITAAIRNLFTDYVDHLADPNGVRGSVSFNGRLDPGRSMTGAASNTSIPAVSDGSQTGLAYIRDRQVIVFTQFEKAWGLDNISNLDIPEARFAEMLGRAGGAWAATPGIYAAFNMDLNANIPQADGGGVTPLEQESMQDMYTRFNTDIDTVVEATDQFTCNFTMIKGAITGGNDE